MSDANELNHLQRLFTESNSRYATVAIVDLPGQLRGKTISATKLIDGYPSGVAFSPLNLAVDYGDHPLLPIGYLTPDLDAADNPCDVDWAQPRTLPLENDDANLLFFADFADDTQGGLWDPRRLYRQVEQQAVSMGYHPVYGMEYEYRLLRESPETLREKNYSNIQLVSEVSNYAGVMHQSLWAGFFRAMRDMCTKMEIDVASMHWESAAAMAEVALMHQPGMRALDNAILFKTYAKVLARQHDLTLTFMARPLAEADGQSGHVHVSLLDDAGNNLFYDANAEHSMSKKQQYFIGGLQKHLPEWLLMLAPNLNSFKRFVTGIFAPTAADWGVDNRTTAIRILGGSPNSQRIELRVPGSDSNPYLVGACLLAAGTAGIAEQLAPDDPVQGASHMREDRPTHLRFPTSFREAVDTFHRSSSAREHFGDDFVEMFAGTRRAQQEAFDNMVTDKERERFLEST